MMRKPAFRSGFYVELTSHGLCGANYFPPEWWNGRHKGLENLRSPEHAGSIPASGTTDYSWPHKSRD